MNRRLPALVLAFYVLLQVQEVAAQDKPFASITHAFNHPPASAKPWVFWYWMEGAVSKAGITADLEAMQQEGIGGAYLMPIKDTSSTIPFQPTVRQLTPEWWAMVKFAMQEAHRLKLQLAMHVSDGFALAGGPWITPAHSMQKLVWTKTYVNGGKQLRLKLDEPDANVQYYKDIAVYALPVDGNRQAFRDTIMVPSVTTSNDTKAGFLAFESDSKESFKCDSACWVQYKFPHVFTCRSITVRSGTNSYQAQRLRIDVSNDGMHFKTIGRLSPPRQGWQDTDEEYTHAIPATRARYFRFVYDKDGSEPGAEDLDAAKWKPSLRLAGLYLSDEAVIPQYQAKNGSVWRVAEAGTGEQVPASEAIALRTIVDVSKYMDTAGNLNWDAPPGSWLLLRMGHTSNGHTNATGGGGKGLECDKFDPAAVTMQFNNWFAKAFESTDKTLAAEVLKIFHVDSWECGSQNWTDAFPREFKKRRGYDMLPWLPAMAGIPVENIAASERFLHDVRQTIVELLHDNFFVTLKNLAHKKGCRFSAESVAPTMVSDGMLHYREADIPMGEFWFNSPSHDKPNDMLDAISGAHVYGKPLIQAEAFTTVRMDWSEHPGSLKATGDRNMALGANKFVLHVFMHNPWMDKKPGMTLDGIGLYFQRDQTWWKPGAAWIAYLQRCQALLQLGKPVADIAVFTGEEIPRRSLLPDRLVPSLPGIFGKDWVMREQQRLNNAGTPLRQKPDGVTISANMADPEKWIDPLNGYSYDSFNPDALLNLARVKNGRIVLPGGASYGALLVPYDQRMNPNKGYMSIAVARKLQQLLAAGATIIMHPAYFTGIGSQDSDSTLRQLMEQLRNNQGKGKWIPLPYTDSSFASISLERDLAFVPQTHSIAWTHRASNGADIYFLSNQLNQQQQVSASFHIKNAVPHLFNPVTGEISNVKYRDAGGRINIDLNIDANGSLFVVFDPDAKNAVGTASDIAAGSRQHLVSGQWTLRFDTAYGGPASPVIYDSLRSWTEDQNPAVKYYSGTVRYSSSFQMDSISSGAVWLVLEGVHDMATVKINGRDCGTLWTPPFRVNITGALSRGVNSIEIAVSNTWANRLIYDNSLPSSQRVTWTNAPFRLKNKPLLPAGITGKVYIQY